MNLSNNSMVRRRKRIRDEQDEEVEEAAERKEAKSKESTPRIGAFQSTRMRTASSSMQANATHAAASNPLQMPVDEVSTGIASDATTAPNSTPLHSTCITPSTRMVANATGKKFNRRRQIIDVEALELKAMSATALAFPSSFISTGSSTHALPMCVTWQSSKEGKRQQRQQQRTAVATKFGGKQTAASSQGSVMLRVSKQLDEEIAMMEVIEQPRTAADTIDLTDESPIIAEAVPPQHPIAATDKSTRTFEEIPIYWPELEKTAGQWKVRRSTDSALTRRLKEMEARKADEKKKRKEAASYKLSNKQQSDDEFELSSLVLSPVTSDSAKPLKRLQRLSDPDVKQKVPVVEQEEPNQEPQQSQEPSSNRRESQVNGREESQNDRDQEQQAINEVKEQELVDGEREIEQEESAKLMEKCSNDSAAPTNVSLSPPAVAMIPSSPASSPLRASGGSSLLHTDDDYPLPWLNELTSSPPPPFRHLIDGNEESAGAQQIERCDELFVGCKCPKGYCGATTCPCRVKGSAGYSNDRLRAQVIEGLNLWECNDSCSCNHKCANRVTQRAGTANHRLPFYLFRRDGCGWGVKCSVSIERGEFIAEYLGERKNEAECIDPDAKDEYMSLASAALLHAADVPELSELLHDRGCNDIDELLARWPRMTVDAIASGNVTRCQTNAQSHSVTLERRERTVANLSST